MKYDFDEEIDRRGTDSVKHDALQRVFGAGDIIPLWVADMDFRTPEFITGALEERLKHPILGYTFRNNDYFRSIVRWVEKRNSWPVDPHWIGFTPGVVAGFSLAIRALTEPGDAILIQPPVYPHFPDAILRNGRKVVENPLKRENGRFEIDFDDFERRIKTVKAFLMCNPHNPTGRVFSRTELERMAALCRENGVLVISDEIHSDLVYAPHRHVHIGSLLPERSVTLFAPSKTFNTAGLFSSVSVIPDPALRQAFDEELERTHIGAGTIFGNIALSAAYAHGAEWVDQLVAYLDANCTYVNDFIRREMPRIGSYKPEATYLMWLDFSDLFTTEDETADFLLREAKLGLNRGSEYGALKERFMRLNVGTTRSRLEQAMGQLKAAYDRHF